MGHKNDLALGIRKAAQFAAGFGFPGGTATAGTAAQISPTLGARVKGGFSAISPGFREFEESRARIGRSSAETNLALEEARRSRLEEEQKQRPVDLRSLTGGVISDRLQRKLEDELKAQGADVDGNGIISQSELEDALPKLDKQVIVDAIGEDIAEFSKSQKQNETNVQSLIDQANKKMLGTGTTITRQDFQANPELGRTFPKIAEAISRQDSLQGKIDVLANKQTAIKGVLKREEKVRVPTRLDVTRSESFDKDLSGVQDELSGTNSNEEKRELVLKLIDFYKGQRNEIIQQLILSHPDIMEQLGFTTGRDTGGRTP